MTALKYEMELSSASFLWDRFSSVEEKEGLLRHLFGGTLSGIRFEELYKMMRKLTLK